LSFAVRKDSVFLVTRNHNCSRYGIPAVWQKFSNKVFGDDIKYQRLYGVGGNGFYQPKIKETKFSEEELKALFENLPISKEDLENLRNLMRVCPLKGIERIDNEKKFLFFT
jgi:hypothetical protein